MIKVISFDLDGTLVDHTNFDLYFWYKEVPRLYSEEYGVALNEAKTRVFSEYDKIGRNHVDWYDPAYWFNRFNLTASHERVINDLRSNVKLFPDTLSVLGKLKKYQLVIVTNSTKAFVKIKMEVEQLSEYFDAVFSAVDDFKTVKKNSRVYLEILRKYGLNSNEIIHIGDDWEFDYLVPRQLGITSFYLDRKKEKDKSDGIVSNLHEFVEKVNEIQNRA
jgi:HAD superfamily hydrolase (TIGR01549 family)